MSIADKQQEILEELSFFPDWQERYEYVIGLGRKLQPMPEETKTPGNLIKGCQSQVWLDARSSGGTVHYGHPDEAARLGIHRRVIARACAAPRERLSPPRHV